MKPLISIIVPVYKVEDYLNRCVESILRQTYQNIEVILVDDGSPDRCPEMCDLWAVKGQRIRVIHKPNGGLSDARNAGIAVASGEYIGFVDSDDYVAPSMYETLYRALSEQQTKLALCSFNCIDEQGVPTGENELDPILTETMDAKSFLPKLYQTGGWFYIVAWNKLYHRSLLRPDTFPKGKIHEDEYVIAQLVHAAGKVACVSEPLYYYVRQRKGSITQNQADINHLDYLTCLLERHAFYEASGYPELLHDTRAILFRDLESFLLEADMKNPDIYSRVKIIKSGYRKLRGLSRSEKVKWIIFCISPRLEKKITEWKRHR